MDKKRVRRESRKGKESLKEAKNTPILSCQR
jgi:hypothetical protein